MALPPVCLMKKEMAVLCLHIKKTVVAWAVVPGIQLAQLASHTISS